MQLELFSVELWLPLHIGAPGAVVIVYWTELSHTIVTLIFEGDKQSVYRQLKEQTETYGKLTKERTTREIFGCRVSRLVFGQVGRGDNKIIEVFADKLH